MGYRQLERKPKPRRRTFHDTSTKNKIFIQNGITGYFAIPCWYNEMKHPIHTHLHNIDHHDHVGWPNPDNPDHSCQSAHRHHLHPHHPIHPEIPYDHHRRGWHAPHHLLDMSKVFPIHLRKEGYTGISVALENPPSGLTVTGAIENRKNDKGEWVDDHIIRLSVTPKCKTVIDNDVDVRYTVFANGSFDGRDVTHMVTKGVIHIIAGPIP